MTARGLGRLFGSECRLFLREPISVFFTMAFPILLLLIFGCVYGHLDVGGGYRFIDVYVPALLATVAANLAFMSLPVTLSLYREQGILERYLVLPAPRWVFLLVQVLVHAAMFLFAAAAPLAVAHFAFHARFGGDIALFGGAAILGLGSMLAMGLVIASLAPSARAAQVIGAAAFFSMLFTSGAAMPRSEFPSWLRRATEHLPLTQIVDLMTRLWVGESSSDMLGSVAFLVALTALAAALAARSFRFQANPSH
jgi:ABC-2 type transport system permease protein